MTPPAKPLVHEYPFEIPDGAAFGTLDVITAQAAPSETDSLFPRTGVVRIGIAQRQETSRIRIAKIAQQFFFEHARIVPGPQELG